MTEADLRRHVAATGDRIRAFETPLAAIERRSSNPTVRVDGEVGSLVEQAATHSFVPVVDAGDRFVGIVDRREVLATRLPSAA